VRMLTSLATEMFLLRRVLNVSQTDFGRLLGISQPSIFALERDQGWPSEATIRSYAGLTMRNPEQLLYAQQVDHAYASLSSHPTIATRLTDIAVAFIQDYIGKIVRNFPPSQYDLRQIVRMRWPELSDKSFDPSPVIPAVAKIIAGLDQETKVAAWYFAADHVLTMLNLSVVYGPNLAESRQCGNNLILASALARHHQGYIIPSPRNRADLIHLCSSKLTVSPLPYSDGFAISFEEPSTGETITLCVP